MTEIKKLLLFLLINKYTDKPFQKLLSEMFINITISGENL